MNDALPSPLVESARHLLERCQERGLMLAVAESCTGGLVSAALTSIAGSSTVVERGFVVYSNAAKIELLGVPPDLIGTFGAVSAEVARAMAEGVLSHSRADLAAAITGIAGPGGATAEKPVGTVFISAARRNGECRVRHNLFPGDRDAIRAASTLTALEMVSDLV